MSRGGYGSGRSALTAVPVRWTAPIRRARDTGAVRRAVWRGAELFLYALPPADEPLEPFLSVLPPDELLRAERFHDKAAGAAFVCGRALLRRLLGERLSTDPRQPVFEYSELGKPSLGGAYAASGLRFSLAHSDGAVLVGMTRGAGIGVDIERFDAAFDPEPIVSRFFPEDERERLSRLPADEAKKEFFRLWVRTEAEGKLTGDGVLRALRRQRERGGERHGAGRIDVRNDRTGPGRAVYAGRIGRYYIGIAVEEKP